MPLTDEQLESAYWTFNNRRRFKVNESEHDAFVAAVRQVADQDAPPGVVEDAMRADIETLATYLQVDFEPLETFRERLLQVAEDLGKVAKVW